MIKKIGILILFGCASLLQASNNLPDHATQRELLHGNVALPKGQTVKPNQTIITMLAEAIEDGRHDDAQACVDLCGKKILLQRNPETRKKPLQVARESGNVSMIISIGNYQKELEQLKR